MGIDGCRAGWLAVSIRDGVWGFELAQGREDLHRIFSDASVCLIDIPIGIDESSPSRFCDELLRRVLGPKLRSSVFSPPVRAALVVNDYRAACDINQSKTGKRISKQVWNIVPKIRQVDEILQSEKNLALKVLESHPELLFKKLNRSADILPKKKTPEGIEMRLDLLGQGFNGASGFFNEVRASFRKNQVADDDIVDAMVLALFAGKMMGSPVRTLPMPPETDPTGLPMAIHFV